MNVYLIELTDHKQTDITYYPFVIWNCFITNLEQYIRHIEANYGKIKAVWECDSEEDARNWRKEILKMRGQEVTL
jgi:hypothetical protein